MEIVTTITGKIVEPIVEYTVKATARQVGYLVFYKDNFKNLEHQIEELKRVKDTISQEVERERRNGRQIYDAAQNWLDKVDEIIEAAEQLDDDPRHRNVGCCKGHFPDLKSRYQFSRRAKKMAGNAAEVVMQEKDNIGLLSYLPGLEGVGFTAATGSEKLQSRKKMKEDIVLALRDPSLSRIGVYGLGGVGKTTLVGEIAKQVKDNKLFDEVVVANISKAADLERIQREIADLLGLRFEEISIPGRALRLKQRIENDKSILIILDDIWEILELDKLGIPLNDHKGCKLLLTSRNLEILQKMDSQKNFLIDVLNEEETWSLFEDMAGDVLKDDSLRDVAIQVAQKCGGLIVLIATVARALKNKHNIDSWKDALNQLKTVDKEGINKIIYSALEFSYNHLEGSDVKAFFLLCGLLSSQDEVEYLLKCVIGLGIFKQSYTPQDVRVRLHGLIDSLKASCLLLENSSSEEVKMHDIVHEVAVSIAARDQHVYKIGRADELRKWPSEEFLQQCTQIIFEWCHIPELPERLECPNIKLFCLCNKNEYLSVPDSFFEGMKNLKVLDLTCMHLPSLPQSVHSLIDLQTLCLDLCCLEDMTNIGALTNLQILSLKGSSMIMLPSELGQLTHLKMLDLTDSGIETFPSNIISKLTELEELYLGNTSIKWDQEDSIKENKNASLTELRHLTNLTALQIQIKEAWVLPRDIMFDKLERYKIVIGDFWEWSDNYGASKILKLKLDTVIHLEHGIKELIKGVEDLSLDEVNGLSNVLYDLNGEGFPLLKHLHIQDNGGIQHIINSMERNLISHVFFQKLETLILQNLNKLEKICHGSFMNNSFAQLRSIKVKCCDQLKYLFSMLMVKALCQLVEVEVSECSSMKKIVFGENSFPNSLTVDDNIEFCSLRSLTLRYLPAVEDFYSGLLMSSTTTQSLSLQTNVPSSFFSAKVKLSNLETLKLSSIHLENIWQDDHLSVANSFHKLSKLSVEECSSLKYLFSSSMVGSFPNLKELQIRECEMMEEIIVTEGRNGTAIEEVRLPKLETIVISNMKKLKKVWHSQFDGLKTMEVNNCEKLENIFPSDMHTTFGRIETLKVSDCGLVKEIFKVPANEITSEEDTRLKNLHLLHLPELRQIWSKDPQGNFRFHNLQDVHVEDCENLEYLFPFSIALNLHQLETLSMNFCGMNEIVANNEGPMDDKATFHFDRLYSLQIWYMHRLDRFCSGSHSLTCPSLKKIWVFDCPKLRLLGRQSTRNHIKNGDDQLPHIFPQQPIFMIEEVVPKLEVWTLNNKEAIMVMQDPQWKDRYLSKLLTLRLSDFEDKTAAAFLDSIVHKAPNLKCLLVQHSSLKEIFRDKRDAYKKGKKKIDTQLESLRLDNLQLQHICREGCKIDPILEVLELLIVTDCANLKSLVPYSTTFSHLKYLEIERCNGLTNLIYSSTATSLVHLEDMTLKECNSVEEIVTQGMNETRDKIVFRSLRTLALESLPRLNSFSSSQCFFRFLLLKKVVVRQCPRMKTFCERATSTPMLRKVIIKEGKDDEWCWEGDLNRTIKKIHADKVAFNSLNHLELSEYPELKELWYSQVGQKTFCNLKHLVVCKCTFLSNVIFSSNSLPLLNTLEELEVSECDSLEAIFDVKVLDDKGKESKEVSRLNKLTLLELPNLKRLWNKEAEEIISFGNLQSVKVDKCPNLKYVFSSSLCQDLRQLEELYIASCGVEQIVANEEGLEEHKFYFPLLRIFKLVYLTQLNDFYAKNYSLECPSLRVLNVCRCEALQMFAFGHLDSQSLREVCVDLPIQQALFHIEKVSENLEELSLNEKDALRVLNGYYEKNPFKRIEILRLQYFHETPIKFLNDLIQKFPATTTLQVRYSSFERLLPSEVISHCSIESPTQIKNLWLFQLEQLKHIWNDDDPASHPLVQNLEDLYIGQCSRIIRLAPPSASFKNLTSLEVKDCNGLIYLMTSCTAKSLVHLTSFLVSNCGMLEEVVKINEGESEEEVTLESLAHLELTCLSSFKSFCSGKHIFIFPSLVTLQVIGCHKMQNFSYGVIIAPFMKSVEVENGRTRWKKDLNTTINQLFIDKAIGEGIEDDNKESSSIQKHQKSAGKSRALNTEEHGAESKAKEIVDLEKQEIHKLPIPHMAIRTEEMNETIQTPFTENGESTSTQTSFQETDETIEKPLVQATHQVTLSPSIVRHTAIDPSPSQEVVASSIEDEDGSQDLQLHASENLLVHTTTAILNDDEENTGTKDETIRRPLVQNAEDIFIPASVQNIAAGTHVTHESIDKLFVQAAQNAWDITIVQNKEESHDSDIHLSKNLFNQTTTSITVDNKETIGIQATRESKRKYSIHDAQNVPGPTMIYDTGKPDDSEIIVENNLSHQTPNSVMAEIEADPAPSKASKATSSRVADVCSSFKEVDKLLPYLEAGVKRHPQVLDWFNTKPRRAFVALFTEVTRILRTTRRRDLTENDRNDIRECCAALEAVGFDASWLNYVYGCIGSCGDGDELKRKLEETEAKVSALRNESSSAEASLVSLRDEASRLDHFIES